MATVTIEGSAMPCTELARGERATVTVTRHIRNLVAIGAVVVVEGSLNDRTTRARGGKVSQSPADDSRLVALDDVGHTIPGPAASIIQALNEAPPADERTETEQIADAEAQGDGPDNDGVPARNASTEVWKRWVAAKIPGVERDDVEDKGRDELIAAWDRYEQQVAGGS